MRKKWGLGSCLVTVACITMAGLAPALAQSFPSKNVSLVVPFPPGGGPDLMARVFAEKLASQWGKPVIVENRPGAGALLGAQAVAKSPADGHTLLLTTNTMVISPHVLAPGAGGGVDVHADLLPVVAPATTPMAMLAHAGLGAVSHLCSLLFRQALGTDFQTVPFGGTAPALNALLGSQVDLLCDQTTNTTSHIKAGTVKMYGVTTPNRIAAMPDQPSLDEQGMKGFQMVVWHGVYAPKGTPPAVLEKLNGAVRAALNNPGFQTRMKELGADVVPESKRTSQGLKSWLQAETERLGLVIRSAGTYAD